jgi:hypothetical protein
VARCLCVFLSLCGSVLCACVLFCVSVSLCGPVCFYVSVWPCVFLCLCVALCSASVCFCVSVCGFGLGVDVTLCLCDSVCVALRVALSCCAPAAPPRALIRFHGEPAKGSKTLHLIPAPLHLSPFSSHTTLPWQGFISVTALTRQTWPMSLTASAMLRGPCVNHTILCQRASPLPSSSRQVSSLPAGGGGPG